MDPLTLALIAFGGSVFSGTSQYKSSKAYASILESEGDQAYYEGLREAMRMREQGDMFISEQGASYLSSGVEIGGSSVVVMAQTKRFIEEEATATERSSLAVKDRAYQNASLKRKEGKASMISSIFGGALNVAGEMK